MQLRENCLHGKRLLPFKLESFAVLNPACLVLAEVTAAIVHFNEYHSLRVLQRETSYP